MFRSPQIAKAEKLKPMELELKKLEVTFSSFFTVKRRDLDATFFR